MSRRFVAVLFALTAVACGADEKKGGPVDGGPMDRFQSNNSDGPTTPNHTTAGTNNDTTGPDEMPLPEGGTCVPGQRLACMDETTQSICGEDGDSVVPTPCPAGEWCLAGECGDQRCVAGTLHCQSPEVVETCNGDGTGYENPQPCPENTLCENGSCKSICDLGGKGPSYIGCEYWTVDLDQYTDPSTNPKPDEIPHAVVISNPGPAPATISFIPRGQGVTVNVPDPVVPVGQARAFTMPRWDVSGSSLSFRAIQILASSPVIAHQFSPLNNANVYSNDASLLLPVTAHGKEYYLLNWPSQMIPCVPGLGFCPEPQHSYVTIVATSPGTTNLNVTPTARIMPGDQIPNFTAGFTRSISLSYGQVMNLQAGDPDASIGSGANDLSGTHILSDKPIAVFVGHEEAVIGNPDNNERTESCCADHIQQQLFPVEAWGNEYIASLSPDRGNQEDLWKIVAAEPVTITFNPPQNGAGQISLGKGEVAGFFSSESFEIQASGKISVAQFLTSQGQTDDVVGDPAMIMAVPQNQYRSDYHVLTPQGYSRDYVAIIRPAGATIEIDGTTIADAQFQPVGSGNWEVATIEVEPGVHIVEGTEPFGLQAYGFDTAVSYAYPGGLNLVGVDEPAP